MPSILMTAALWTAIFSFARSRQGKIPVGSIVIFAISGLLFGFSVNLAYTSCCVESEYKLEVKVVEQMSEDFWHYSFQTAGEKHELIWVLKTEPVVIEQRHDVKQTILIMLAREQSAKNLLEVMLTLGLPKDRKILIIEPTID